MVTISSCAQLSVAGSKTSTADEQARTGEIMGIDGLCRRMGGRVREVVDGRYAAGVVENAGASHVLSISSVA